MFTSMIKSYLIGRLKERSTWTSIIGSIAAGTALHFSGAQVDSLVNLGLAAVAAVVTFVPDKPVDRSHPPLV